MRLGQLSRGPSPSAGARRPRAGVVLGPLLGGAAMIVVGALTAWYLTWAWDHVDVDAALAALEEGREVAAEKEEKEKADAASLEEPLIPEQLSGLILYAGLALASLMLFTTGSFLIVSSLRDDPEA